MDSTTTLTEKVLLAEGMTNISSAYLHVNNPSEFSWNPKNEYISRIKLLFSLIKEYLGTHYSFSNRELNYEDYYYIIDSMHQDENMNLENPIVTFFNDYLVKNNPQLFHPIDKYYSNIRLIELCSEAKNYIKDVVTSNLNTAPSTLIHLTFLKEACKENYDTKNYVFTLNHDTILEQFFDKNELKYSDGFNAQQDGLKIWNKDNFTENLILLKLHGSVNWFRLEGKTWYDEQIIIPNTLIRGLGRPILLIGSFNKIYQYNRGISFELQCLFAKYLDHVQTLIVSGYSFGDQGVNNRLIDWIYKCSKHRLIVVHPDADNLGKFARPAIAGKWKMWLNEGILSIIPKYIEELTWTDIRGYL